MSIRSFLIATAALSAAQGALPNTAAAQTRNMGTLDTQWTQPTLGTQSHAAFACRRGYTADAYVRVAEFRENVSIGVSEAIVIPILTEHGESFLVSVPQNLIVTRAQADYGRRGGGTFEEIPNTRLMLDATNNVPMFVQGRPTDRFADRLEAGYAVFMQPGDITAQNTVTTPSNSVAINPFVMRDVAQALGTYMTIRNPDRPLDGPVQTLPVFACDMTRAPD